MSLERIAKAEAAHIVGDVARALVNRPEDVLVQVVEGHLGDTLIRLYVAPEDQGQVIGKRGRTAHCLRTLLSAMGSHRGVRYTLDICEPPETDQSVGLHSLNR